MEWKKAMSSPPVQLCIVTVRIKKTLDTGFNSPVAILPGPKNNCLLLL
jgi:hypothetical protein